jgi:hypothetical protein
MKRALPGSPQAFGTKRPAYEQAAPGGHFWLERPSTVPASPLHLRIMQATPLVVDLWSVSQSIHASPFLHSPKARPDLSTAASTGTPLSHATSFVSLADIECGAETPPCSAHAFEQHSILVHCPAPMRPRASFAVPRGIAPRMLEEC